MAQAESKQKTLKVGILGFGSMGKTHAFAIESLPYYYDLPFSAEVTAVTCRTEEKATAVCDTFHIPTFATWNPTRWGWYRRRWRSPSGSPPARPAYHRTRTGHKPLRTPPENVRKPHGK